MKIGEVGDPAQQIPDHHVKLRVINKVLLIDNAGWREERQGQRMPIPSRGFTDREGLNRTFEFPVLRRIYPFRRISNRMYFIKDISSPPLSNSRISEFFKGIYKIREVIYRLAYQ